MKRIVSLILILSMLMSFAGCSVSQEEIEQGVQEWFEGEVNQAKQTLADQVTAWWDGVWDSICFWDQTPDDGYTIHYIAEGAINVPADQTIGNKPFSSKRLSDQTPVRDGYRFLGWGTAAEAAEPAYKPGQKWKGDQSETLYALWEACTHFDKRDKLYGLNLEEAGRALCVECGADLPFSSYFFSDYLKVVEPKTKGDYTELDTDQLKTALLGYVQLKGYGYEKALKELDLKGGQNAEIILNGLDYAHETVKKVDEVVQLFYHDNKMNVYLHKGDKFRKVESAQSHLDIFRAIMMAGGSIHSMVAFGDACDQLEEAEREGIENTYRIEMQKIETGMKFAKTLGDFVGFYYAHHSPVGAHTISGLLPDIEQIQSRIEDLKYADVSNRIFNALSSLSEAPKDIGQKEKDRHAEVFRSKGGKRSVESVLKDWADGPTSSQTAVYIDLLARQPGDKDEKEELLKDLYFYLGWRVEYECICAVQMILDDQI